MFKVLIITFIGIALGYLFRKVKVLQKLSESISWTIWLLLFFFGLQVGANEQVVGSLDTLGLKALFIALAGSLGSCVTAWGLSRWVLKDATHQYTSDHRQAIPQSPDNGYLSEEKAQLCNTNLSGRKDTLGTKMKRLLQYAAGFITAGFFAVGCVCGMAGIVPQQLCGGAVSMYVLYALMVQVGMSVGCDRRLKEMLTSLSPKLFLLPVGTIVGTLVAVAAAGMAMQGLKLSDCLAVGAGFGYYSLSSVLITQIKEPEVGAALAAQIGTIALMANIIREIITLLFAPAIRKVFGRLAPISAGGATSMDSTLPVITVACGKEMAFISIFHGVLVDFSVPFLVTFFASL